jgi:hypothetical protein
MTVKQILLIRQIAAASPTKSECEMSKSIVADGGCERNVFDLYVFRFRFHGRIPIH